MTTDTETPSPNLPWGLEIVVEDIQHQEGGRLHAYTVSESFARGGSLIGVNVALLNEDMEVVEEIPLGNFTGVGVRKHFNTTISTLPLYITATIDEVDLSQPRNGVIDGKYIDANGNREIYRVEDYENYIR